MKVAIIGASGKTGTKLVRESLKRGNQVVAVCRDSSVGRLDEFTECDGFTVMAVPVVSDEATLTRALAGCDAVVAVLITVRRLKATELALSREDYAVCMLDSLENSEHHRRTLAVVPADA